MSDKFNAFLRIIHWLMFILFAVIFVVGVVMVEFKETKPWAMYDFHKSLGVLVFLLVWLRLVSRWTTQVPLPPSEMSSINHRIAQGVVYLLYLLMIIVPISGYALSNVHGHNVDLFGLPLLKVFPTNPEWEGFTTSFHEISVYIFLGVFVLHLLGVIKHHVKGLDILRRIT
ncbi:cytochrome b/b6 domain-containing protein [Candidatus Parabeggiatoa sp. HSG14]|uniref:cytochrome b n=1 Tax=Candidatus Parabeggiatoa sp. HSG14 TaxID=3055593 RepID=UPI0025A87DAD|nr:cytochrome b/b6 domain-containing protein [Thiotrichales bacterium HSG14]